MEPETQAPAPEAPESSDTVEEQSSEASAPVETAPEASAEETAEQERLYAGKYKSVEDLEKSYTELQSKYGQTTNEKAELSRVLESVLYEPPAPVASTPQADTGTEYAEVEPKPADPETEKLKRDTALLKFSIRHPNADGKAMLEIMQTDPSVRNISDYDTRLEYAYLRAEQLRAPQALKASEQAGQAKAEAKVAEKEVARVESAKRAEPADQVDELKAKAFGESVVRNPKEREDAQAAYLEQRFNKRRRLS